MACRMIQVGEDQWDALSWALGSEAHRANAAARHEGLTKRRRGKILRFIRSYLHVSGTLSGSIMDKPPDIPHSFFLPRLVRP